MSDAPNTPDTDDEPVPKIPYGRGLKLDNKMLFRIGATLLLLVLIVVATRPCANATSKFVTDFDEKKGSASEAMPRPGNVDQLDPAYEVIPTNATPEERDAAIARARAAAEARKARAGSGSNATGSNAAGSNAAGSNATGSNAAGSNATGSAN